MKVSNTSFLLQLTCSLFILLFVYTALSKFHEFNSFKVVLGKSPFIKNKNEILAWCLPIVELIVAGLLFFPTTRRLGLYSSLVLMITFTLYIGYMIAFTPHLPCSCGGVIKQMSWKQHLLFNIFFTALAFIGIVIDSRYTEPVKQKNIVTHSPEFR